MWSRRATHSAIELAPPPCPLSVPTRHTIAMAHSIHAAAARRLAGQVAKAPAKASRLAMATYESSVVASVEPALPGPTEPSLLRQVAQSPAERANPTHA